ncbi:hypothetical protein Bca101_065083 [Brassica carinata]
MMILLLMYSFVNYDCRTFSSIKELIIGKRISPLDLLLLLIISIATNLVILCLRRSAT